MTARILLIPAILYVGTCAAQPLVMQRYRGTQTEDPKIWEGTFEALKANPGVADDVWFSTGIGYPSLAWHREHSAFLGRSAEKCRAAGIEASLQLQATLGHGDGISSSADCSAKNWGGFTGEDGTEARYCSCPRQPAFIEYFREVGRIYASWKPHTIWVDDDLRMHNHNPVKEGCWCKTCVGEFSRREKCEWTRETLAKACKADAALNDRWRAFSEHSLVEFISVVIAAVHEVSPTTRFGLQCGPAGAHNFGIFKAMSDGTGLPASIRAGGGAYFDRDPFQVVHKAFYIGGMLQLIKDYGCMGAICPEIENCPRSYGCKTVRGTCVEGILALAQGCNSLSIFATDADLESPEWYSRHVYAGLAAAHPLFKAYAKAVENTQVDGFFYPGFCADKFVAAKLIGPDPRMLSIGLPVVSAPGRYRGLILDAAVVNLRSDVELKRLIGGAKSVILDGAAAEALVRRGFAADLGGLSAGASGVKKPGFSEAEGFRNEIFTDDPLNRGCGVRHATYFTSGHVVDFSDVAAKRVLGSYRRRDGTSGGSATVLATLRDGRRVAVLGYSGFIDRGVSSGRLLQLQRIADWASGEALPLVLEEGVLAVVGVRTAADGTFAAATVLNTTIGCQSPLKLRIRGLRDDVTALTCRAFERDPQTLPVVRDGKEALVTLPALDGWNCAVVTER